MMKKDKILINVNNLDDIEKYKKLGITNFLFGLSGFTIGYSEFTLEEISKINGNVYVLVNKILTDEDIDEFLKLDIPASVVGFVIEDTGLYYALKDTKYELINFQNHLNNNFKTINYWLNHFDSLVLSTDITLEEIKEILSKCDEPIIINALGYPMIMYSRRQVVSNYYRHMGKEPKKSVEIDEPISKNKFLLKENNYGTAVFNNQVTNYIKYLDELDDSKIKFYLVNTEFLEFDDVEKALRGEELNNQSDGFINKKTIYRVGGEV